MIIAKFMKKMTFLTNQFKKVSIDQLKFLTNMPKIVAVFQK